MIILMNQKLVNQKEKNYRILFHNYQKNKQNNNSYYKKKINNMKNYLQINKINQMNY